ncbi:IucC family-domain-containing protein [Fennellomyces sp. T-0311]|nr:IucC family-domain-containing protein [Fennellomyces sp. T-0311]
MPVTYVTPRSSRYGKFATTSRLISCLIVEDLVNAYFSPCEQDNENCAMIGLCMVLRAQVNNTQPTLSNLDDIMAIIPLRGLPELDMTDCITLNGILCPKIVLLDPWDMLPNIYAPQKANTLSFSVGEDSLETAAIYNKVLKATRALGFSYQDVGLVDEYDANHLWCQFSQDYGIDEETAKLVASELDSAMLHQTYTYDHPKPLPTLQSSALEWEQSIVEGHPTHPMHKTRSSFPPLLPLYPDQVDFERPKIRLVAIPVNSILIRGDFETLVAPLVDVILSKTGEQRYKYAGHVLMPIHEMQVPNVEERFKNAIVLPPVNHVIGCSLASLRTVAFPDILDNLTVKMSIGIKVTSALRTITPNTTYFGPGFSKHVVPRLSYDRQILVLERELASAVYCHPDTDVAKHCACVLREVASSNSDEIHIVSAALMEKTQRPDTEETMVTYALNLDTEEKREKFLDKYIQLILKAFIPPCRDNGVAFEAHAQNVLARMDRSTGELTGFVIRDFGGLRIHNETLRRTCGIELDILPNSPVAAKSMDNVYNSLYHTLFSNHLQRMIRVLGMHHNGRGWQMVRQYFSELVSSSDPMYRYFMEQEKILGKCFVLMKIEGLYRDHIYRPKPNLILSGCQKRVIK